MHPYYKERQVWQVKMAACSDEDLVAMHNDAVGLRCFGLGRQVYLGCLERELIARDFDSGILINRDVDGKVVSYRLAFKAMIVEINGSRSLVPCQND